jgi:thioesterase domain-containing protein/acyl carrier protein
LPLTISGKLDRRALPEPKVAAAGALHVGPRSALEAQICAIYAHVLQVARVGVHDNFFELGGDSLQAMVVVPELRHVTGFELMMGDVFDHPTPASLALHLEAARPAPEGAGEVRPVVFLISDMGGESPRLHRLRQGCRHRLDIVLIDLPDWSELVKPGYDIASLSASLVPQVVSQSQKRPICIAGYSLGGVVAYALAEALAEAHHEVALLAIIDTDLTRPFAERYYDPEALRRHGKWRLRYWELHRIVGRRVPGLRSSLIAHHLAPRLAGGWGRTVLRHLTPLRALWLPRNFRFFLHRQMCAALQSRAADAWRNARNAVPVPLDVPATLLVAGDTAAGGDSGLGWRPHFTAVRLVPVGGTHASMFHEPHLSVLCDRFAAAVEGATVPGRPGQPK